MDVHGRSKVDFARNIEIQKFIQNFHGDVFVMPWAALSVRDVAKATEPIT